MAIVSGFDGFWRIGEGGVESQNVQNPEDEDENWDP